MILVLLLTGVEKGGLCHETCVEHDIPPTKMKNAGWGGEMARGQDGRNAVDVHV